jgi:6-phosphogluconolactonase (cycloisomerase 2 family)
MKLLPRIVAAGVLLGATTALAANVAAGTASAATPASPHDHAVFVETDNRAGNQVAAYARGRAGTLTLSATYQTQGLGGQLNGSVVDHQASQGALGYDAAHRLLFATNAGSDTVSVFSVRGANLELRQVINSGGDFPVSVAQHGEVVYVLNARDGGNVTGYRIAGSRLAPVRGSSIDLGFTAVTNQNEFTHTPGQVSFSPDGSQLLITTKALGQSVLVFHFNPNGVLNANPVVNGVGNTPFSLSFISPHRLLLVEAAGDVASFTLDRSGHLEPLDSVPTNQQASCWIASAGRHWFVSNAGSASLTGISAHRSGTVIDLGHTMTDPGTIDAAATPDGTYLYVQTGATGTLDSFRVQADGSLTAIHSPITVANAAGGQGIAAS